MIGTVLLSIPLLGAGGSVTPIPHSSVASAAGEVTATFYDGVLRLEGTAANESLWMHADLGYPAIQGNGTTINGAEVYPLPDAAELRAIFIDLGAGDDYLGVELSLRSVRTSIRMGAGRDRLSFFDGQVGTARIDLGPDDDVLQMVDAITRGLLIVTAGPGDDLVSLSTLVTRSFVLIQGGPGHDVLTALDCSFAPPLRTGGFEDEDVK